MENIENVLNLNLHPLAFVLIGGGAWIIAI